MKVAQPLLFHNQELARGSLNAPVPYNLIGPTAIKLDTGSTAAVKFESVHLDQEVALNPKIPVGHHY